MSSGILYIKSVETCLAQPRAVEPEVDFANEIDMGLMQFLRRIETLAANKTVA